VGRKNEGSFLKKIRFNKQFYRSADFIFAVFLLVLEIAIYSNKNINVGDVQSSISDPITWIIVAFLFLLKSMFGHNYVQEGKGKVISRRNYFLTLIAMLASELVLAILAISNVIDANSTFRLFLVVAFFGLFFGSTYAQEYIASANLKNNSFSKWLILLIILLLGIPVALFALFLK
jgi:uncharacterized membrane protein YhaH (DUF805 family)